VTLVTRYQKIEPFKLSSQQVLKYLEFKGYGKDIPLNPKTRKPTTGKKAVARLLRKFPTDPVLQQLRLIRGLKKVIGDLSDKYIHSDGKFHPVWVLDVSTGRMACGAPNLTNQPQGRFAEERERAMAQRSSIIAAPGFSLISRDWMGSQAQLTAWFANDPSYARVSRLGAHAYYNSHLDGKPVDLERPDEAVAADLAYIKKTSERYGLSKAINLALPFGLGPFLLAEEVGCSFKQACEYLMVHENMFPLVKAWKDQLRKVAHADRTLRNPFGWVSPFYFDIYRKKLQDGETVWEANGKQANQVLAQQPQSTEAAMLKEVLLDVDEKTKDDPDFHLLVPVHDEVLGEARIGTEAKYMKLLATSMEHPWPELNGFSIGTEGKWAPGELGGSNWGPYDEATNPFGMRDYHDPA
jgi:DNA polymerase-1